jgi:lysophospholipase L1-like esterase
VLRWLRRGGAWVTLGAGGLLVLEAVAARRRQFLYDAPSGRLEERFGEGKPPLHLVVVGDSTAIGVGAGSLDRSYPVLLAQRLAGDFTVRLGVAGRSGARWADVARQLAPKVSELAPDIILIAVGGNDAIHFTPLRRLDRDIGRALDGLAETGSKVVVGLGPRFDTPALMRPLRDLVDARCRAVNRRIVKQAQRRTVLVLDLRASIGRRFARDPRRYHSEDLFHPGPEGYALWAEALAGPLAEAARERLAEPRTGSGGGGPGPANPAQRSIL